MGRLTDDMTQLRGNIDSSRESRLDQQNQRVINVNAQLADFAETRIRNGKQDARARATFIANNASSVNGLLGDFYHARQVMGQQGRESRANFVSYSSRYTLDLLTNFNADRKGMAERTAKERTDFMASLTGSVSAFINEAAQDRAGARAAFFGEAFKKKKTI
jgi:hypothetical protein